MLAERLEKEGATKMEIGGYYLKASWAERMIGKGRERSLQYIELKKECQSRALKYFGDAPG